MKAILRFAFIGLFIACVARIHAAMPLINLVDENAPFVLSVHDVPTLLKNWEKSPWAQTWNDEQMKKFLAPLRARMKVDEWDEQCKAECGYTLTELLSMAKGDALLALTSMDFPMGDGEPSPADLPLFLAIEIGDNAARIGKIIAANDEKEHASVRIEEFAGVKLHIYVKADEKGGGEEFVWAMADGVWLLSPSKTTLQKSIDALQKGKAAASLGESERFLQIKKQCGDSSLTLLVNMQSIYPAIKKAVDAKAEKSGVQPMGMPPGVILAALGLDAIKDFYLGVNVGESATEFNGGLTYTEQRGILKLLAYHDGPAAMPAFVSAKWITVTSLKFSLLDTYTAIRELLDAMNPAVGGMVQGQIKGLNKQLGVDLEHDLLGSLGDDVIVASAPRAVSSADAPVPLTEFDQFYALSLQNSAAFTNAVEALKRMVGPQADKLFEKREYLNQTIYTYAAAKAGGGQKGFSYSITPKYLFMAVGTPATIETALQGLDGKQRSLWQLPEVKEALADVPAKACSVQYQDTHAMIGSVIETFVQLAPLFAPKAKAQDGEEDGVASEKPEEDKSPFNVSAKPDSAALAKYWSNAAGYAWKNSQGLYFHSKLNHAK
jgi:hypothetical protein